MSAAHTVIVAIGVVRGEKQALTDNTWAETDNTLWRVSADARLRCWVLYRHQYKTEHCDVTVESAARGVGVGPDVQLRLKGPIPERSDSHFWCLILNRRRYKTKHQNCAALYHSSIAAWNCD